MLLQRIRPATRRPTLAGNKCRRRNTRQQRHVREQVQKVAWQVESMSLFDLVTSMCYAKCCNQGCSGSMKSVFRRPWPHASLPPLLGTVSLDQGNVPRYSRHDREGPAFEVPEERHPVLGAAGMTMNQLRGIDELRAPMRLGVEGPANIGGAEIQDGFQRRLCVRLKEAQTRGGSVEEGQVIRREQLRQPPHITMPACGCVDVPHRLGNLSDAEWEIVGAYLLAARASHGDIEPPPQGLALRHAEFRHCVVDVKLDGVETHVPPLGDLPARHSMLHGVHDAPLCLGEHIDLGRPSSLMAHRAIVRRCAVIYASHGLAPRLG